MEPKIISFNKFKDSSKYKKFTHSVDLNMDKCGYSLIADYFLETGERSVDCAKAVAKSMNLSKGVIVWRRSKDLWGCPYLFLYYNENG